MKRTYFVVAQSFSPSFVIGKSFNGMDTVFSSVNKFLLHSPPSLPIPEFLYPPNGALSSLIRGVLINTPLMRELRAPFGGYKNSGIGRDGGEWSRNLFTEEKTVSIPLKDFPITKLGEKD